MKVLQTGIVLYRPPKETPGRFQVGDVARLASGRLVARCRFDFGDGTSAYACRDYDPDQPPEAAPQCLVPTDWSRWIDEELNRWPGQYRRLEPRDQERERAEFEKFRGEWPHVAARIAEAIDLEDSPPPADRFNLGQVLWINRSFHSGVRVDWRSLADRHAAGSFGLYGEYNEAPVSEEELWTLAEQPIAVANRAAIAANAGPVRSRFALQDDRPQHAQTNKPQLAVADVVTLLGPRGPRTLITAHFVDVET